MNLLYYRNRNTYVNIIFCALQEFAIDCVTHLQRPGIRVRAHTHTKFSKSRHWKRPRLADDHLQRSSEKKITKPKYTTYKFDLEKLKDPNVLETFQAKIGGKFAPLTIMNNEDADMHSLVTTFNTAVTETASEILGKNRQKKKKTGSLRKFLICATKREN